MSTSTSRRRAIRNCSVLFTLSHGANTRLLRAAVRPLRIAAIQNEYALLSAAQKTEILGICKDHDRRRGYPVPPNSGVRIEALSTLGS